MTALLAILTRSIPLPVWALTGALAGLVGLLLANAHAHVALAGEKAAHALYVAQAEKGAADASENARAVEHTAQATVAAIQSQIDQEHSRAETIERDLVAAQHAGTFRVRRALCASASGVSVHAGPSASSDAGTDDGDHLAAAAVRAGAEADGQIHALQQYARACQAARP